MKRIQKPIVVYVLTILIVVGYGIIPFLTAFPVLGRRFIFGALPFNGSITMLYGPDGDASFLLVFISLFLCVFSVVAAIEAFFGSTRLGSPLSDSLRLIFLVDISCDHLDRQYTGTRPDYFSILL